MLDRFACNWEASGLTRFALMLEVLELLGRPRFRGRFVVGFVTVTTTAGSDFTSIEAGEGVVEGAGVATSAIVPAAALRRSSRNLARDSRIAAGLNAGAAGSQFLYAPFAVAAAFPRVLPFVCLGVVSCCSSCNSSPKASPRSTSSSSSLLLPLPLSEVVWFR